MLEVRQQYTFYGILLYVACIVYVLFLSLNEPDAETWNALFWVNMLFISINAVAKSFLQESKGKMLYYYSLSSAREFIIAKLLYNIVLMIVMSLLSLFTFSFFLGAPFLDGLKFTALTLLGGISMCLVFTLMAAIASRANQNAAIMVIMGFPVIIPQLMLLIRISKSAFGEIFKEGAVIQMVLLLGGLDVLVIALCMILFPFLWKD
jgi:heme exporter protein B